MVHSALVQGWKGSLHLVPSRASLLNACNLSITDLVKTFNRDHHSFVAECCTHFPGDDGFSNY